MKYIVVVFALIFVSCSSDDVNPSTKCTDQELYDQIKDQCVPRIRDVDTDMGDTSTFQPDTKPTEDTTHDIIADMKTDTGLPDPKCDKDHDGEPSKECGGNDCDDNNIRRKPGYPEVCDEIDNNCDGFINNGIVCTFYAHTGQTETRGAELYSIDPFLKTAISEGEIKLPGTTDALKDIDTHPTSGLLYGVNSSELFRHDTSNNTWHSVGKFGKINGKSKIRATGMAIDSEGTMFVTADDKIYTIDVNNGKAALIGALGDDHFSSGDCVVNKRDTLFMTSKGSDSKKWNEEAHKDKLVSIDRATGIATPIGDTGFKKIYGLVSGWGYLFGVTDGSTQEKPVGEIISIDPFTGEGTLVHAFEGIRWFGSASEPKRGLVEQ